MKRLVFAFVGIFAIPTAADGKSLVSRRAAPASAAAQGNSTSAATENAARQANVLRLLARARAGAAIVPGNQVRLVNIDDAFEALRELDVQLYYHITDDCEGCDRTGDFRQRVAWVYQQRQAAMPLATAIIRSMAKSGDFDGARKRASELKSIAGMPTSRWDAWFAAAERIVRREEAAAGRETVKETALDATASKRKGLKAAEHRAEERKRKVEKGHHGVGSTANGTATNASCMRVARACAALISQPAHRPNCAMLQETLDSCMAQQGESIGSCSSYATNLAIVCNQ